MGIPTWEAAFQEAQLGDKRRNRRAIMTAKQIEQVTGQKGASVALRGHGELKAVSRLLRAEDVTMETLTEGFIRESCKDIDAEHVLIIEDTTELNYAWRKKKIKGLGPTGNGEDQGFFIHPAIVVEPERKALLGLAAIEWFARQYGERTTAGGAHKKKPIEEKESYRWITAAQQGCQQISEKVVKTVVADREADIYDIFEKQKKGALGENCELLIRACRNRKIQEEGRYLYEEVDRWEGCGTIRVQVNKTGTREAREATCTIRYGQITMELPRTRRAAKGNNGGIKVWVVDVREEGFVVPEESLHWMLLTTWEINGYEDAVRIIRWYQCRWVIEELFRILKSGYEVESVRFESGHQLMNWCALRLMMAVKVLYLQTHRKDEEVESAAKILSEEEIEVLDAFEEELVSKKSTIRIPPKRTVAWASLLIAILGGYKATPSAKPFGHICLWRGLARFEGAVIGYRVALKRCGKY